MKGFFDQHDPDFQEVMTRVFLFKNSTMRQRLDALKHHFAILRTFFSDDVIHELYWGKGYTLWTSPDESLPWKHGSSLIRPAQGRLLVAVPLSRRPDDLSLQLPLRLQCRRDTVHVYRHYPGIEARPGNDESPDQEALWLPAEELHPLFDAYLRSDPGNPRYVRYH